MRILFLYNKLRKGGGVGKNSFFGLYELRKLGVRADYLEIEDVYPAVFAKFFRKVLGMHGAHLPLMPWMFSYDAVFTSTAYGALLFKCIFGIKRFKWVILDFNIRGTIGEAQSLKQKIFRWMVSGVDGIVTISEAEQKLLVQLFPHLEKRVVFLHEATDLELFKPQTAQDEEYVLSVGNFGRDFKVLVEAARGADFKVKIAGKPNQLSGIALPSNVSVDLYPPEKMPELYAKAAVVFIGLKVDPRYADSVGTLALGEAMAMGKAIVVTRTKSMESYIEDGKNGVFVPQGDSVVLRATIERLLADSATRGKLGAAAQTFAFKNLSLDDFATKLKIFLEQIIEGK